MKYFFNHHLNENFVCLNTESLDELDILSRLPFIYKNKTRSLLYTRFQYLVNLNRMMKVRPATSADLKLLKKRFEEIKYYHSLSKDITPPEFPYQKYIKKSSPIKLKKFQLVGSEYMYRVKQCVMADDVGLGKTIQTLVTLCRLIDEGHIEGSILIVTLASVKHQWKNEILENIDLKLMPSMRNLCVVEGALKDRKLLYGLKRKIYIMNYEQFIFDFSCIATMKITIDAIICDEASQIKNPSAQRTKKIKTLMRNVKFKYLLTATPIENKLMDLFSLYDFIDKTIFISHYYFLKCYCIFSTFRLKKSFFVKDSITGKHKRIVKEVGPPIKKFKQYINLEDAKYKFRGYYIRRTAEGAGVDMPEFVPQLRVVKLLPEQRKLYNKVKDNADMSPIKKRHTLHAICNDPESLGEEFLIKSAKIKELMYLLENDLSDKKIIVFSEYRRFMNVLYRKLKKYNPLYIHGGVPSSERERIKQKFNKLAKYKILLATRAAERGLDSPVASVIINMDLPDNPSRLKQRAGRGRRLSSKHKYLHIINILGENTIEQKTVERIFGKMELFQKFFSEDTPDLVVGNSFYDGLSMDEVNELY